jgi:hypothetical protein
MNIFEALMIFCFGLAWPVSIYKSYRTKQVKGKSLFFLYVILTGYASGIVYKIFYNYDVVLILYILNFVMVSIDILLYYKYRDK